MRYAQEAYTSNWLAPMGPNIDAFEKDLESYVGEEASVASLISGTAAIHLALRMAGIAQGDIVLCQSFTFVAAANPIHYQGALPVFIDSEKETWNMCPKALEEAIQDLVQKGTKPKAILVVHLYGMPAKIAAIAEIAKRYSITLIEDAAEALGSSYKGQKCGTFGDFGILSFNGNKIITTSGGGALVCQTAADKQKAIFLATQAKDDAPHYQHSEIGYNYRMSNVLAGIGRGQMEVLGSRVASRRGMHSFYKKVFAEIQGVTVFQEPNADYYSNHWLSCVLIDPSIAGFSREDLRVALLEDNIESRPLWKPMHLQPVFKNAPFYGGNVAEDLFTNGLCLPSGSSLTNTDRTRIKAVIQALVRRSSARK